MVSTDTRQGKDSQRLPLSQKHLDDLHKSGLSEETIRRAGIYSEKDPAAGGKLLNWNGPARMLGTCLVFPYPNASGESSGYCRIKPDKPRVKNGKPHKYEAPLGQGNRLYFPPGTLSVLSHPSTPLLITEGEKKALKADQEGFPCIALSGVDCGMKDGELIADFGAIPWQGRTAYIVFDSDAATNRNVQWAEWRLAEGLGELGADVRIVRLPDVPAGKDGKP
jgi:putative DNA primase/helicase